MTDITRTTLVLTGTLWETELASLFARLALIGGVEPKELEFTSSVWLHVAGDPQLGGSPLHPRWFNRQFDGLPELRWAGLDPGIVSRGSRLTYRPYDGTELLLVPHPKGWCIVRLTLIGGEEEQMARHPRTIVAFEAVTLSGTRTVGDEHPLLEGGLADIARSELLYAPHVGGARQATLVPLIEQYFGATSARK